MVDDDDDDDMKINNMYLEQAIDRCVSKRTEGCRIWLV